MVGLTVTGCTQARGGDAADGPGQPPSYTAPSTAPTPVAVAVVDTDTAVDFVMAWFELLNYGFASGDADPLRQSTGLGCFTCANWIREVQGMADQNAERSSAFIHVDGMALIGQADENFSFRASLVQDAGTLSTEIVELTVGISTSSLSGARNWTMKSITPPAG